MSQDLLKVILEAPESQIDKHIIEKLKNLQTLSVQDRPQAMKSILDECAYGSHASDLAMMTMDILWQAFKKEAESNGLQTVD